MYEDNCDGWKGPLYNVAAATSSSRTVLMQTTPQGNACMSYWLPNVSSNDRSQVDKRSDRVCDSCFCSLTSVLKGRDICFGRLQASSHNSAKLLRARLLRRLPRILPVARRKDTAQHRLHVSARLSVQVMLLREAHPPASLPSEWTAAGECRRAPIQLRETVRQRPLSRLPAGQNSRSQFQKVLLWRNPSSCQAGAVQNCR